MALENGDTHLGVSMAGSKLRLVEAHRTDGEISIVSAVEIQLDIPFDFYVIGNDEFVPKFANVIKDIVESRCTRAKSAAFALERRMVLLKKLLVDSKFNPEEVKRHVEWEIEQLIVSARSEYNVAYEQLGIFRDELEEVIVVAVRKAIIKYLNDIFSSTSLELTSVDVDMFAAIRALMLDEDGVDALVNYSDRGVFLCVIKNGNYYDSTEVVPTDNGSGTPGFTEVSDVEMAKIVMDELYKLLTNDKSKMGVEDIRSIYVAGDNVAEDFISELERLQTAEVQIANPFKRYSLSFDSESEMEVEKNPERFLVSVGLATMQEL